MTARKTSEDESIRRFFEALRPIAVSGDGPYQPMDRYRDFATVFSSDAGRRVLSQIVAHCEDKVPREDAPDEACRGYVVRRRVGLWLASMLLPPRAPVQTKRNPRMTDV